MSLFLRESKMGDLGPPFEDTVAMPQAAPRVPRIPYGCDQQGRHLGAVRSRPDLLDDTSPSLEWRSCDVIAYWRAVFWMLGCCAVAFASLAWWLRA